MEELVRPFYEELEAEEAAAAAAAAEAAEAERIEARTRGPPGSVRVLESRPSFGIGLF